MAGVTGVDAITLSEVAQRMTTGEPLQDKHNNALGRFDLGVTAILDAAYQRAEEAAGAQGGSRAALARGQGIGRERQRPGQESAHQG